MADTNDLRVIVGLNVTESAVEIEKDLPELEKILASKESGRLKIVGQLNVKETEKLINAQLSELNIDKTALKITPQLDTSGANNIGEQISKQVASATKNVDFSAIAKNLRKAFNINDNASIKEATENIKAMYEAFNVDPAKYKDAFNRLIGWYEQRSNDFVRTEREKVDELNNLMLELYNQPELHTTLPGLSKASKDNPLVVTKGTLEEMKSLLGSMKEVYKLFGSIRVDDKHGALIGSFGEDWDPKEYNDSLGVYIQYLQKIQELRKSSRFQPTDVMPQSEYESIIKLTEQNILQQLGLVDANNKVIQSNEQVAQSERDVAQSQKEVDNAKKNTNTDKSSDDALKKLMRTTEILEKITKQYELIKYYMQQQSQYKVGTDEWEYYNKAWQEEKQRLDVTKQIAQAEGLVTEEYKKQATEAQKRIDEKYAQLNNTKTIRNTNGGNYLSNNQVQDIFASLNEAERYFKNFNLGTVTSSLTKGSLQGLKDFVIEVKSATGEVEKFRYAVENIGDDQNPQLVYKLTDIKAANAGIEKLIQQLEKLKSQYNTKIDVLVATNPASASGLKSQIEDFKKMLNGLGTTSSIKDVEEAFNNIVASSAKITSNLRSVTASLNPQEQGLNHYREMETIISGISTQFNNLVVKNDDLGSAIDNTKNHLKDLQELEKTEGGTTLKWSEAYRQVNIEIAEIASKVNEAVKAEGKSLKADKTSQYQKQLEHLKKIQEAETQIVSLTKRRVNAGEAEKAEIDKQLKAAQQRITYHTKEYEKKKAIAEIQEQINRAENNASKQNDLTNAKAIDNLTAKYREMSQSIAQGIENMQKLRDNSVLDDKNSSATQSIVSQIESVMQAYRELMTAVNEGSAFTTVDNLKNDVTTLKTLEGIFNNLEQQLRNVSASASDAKASVQQLENNTKADNQLTNNFKSLSTEVESAYRSFKKFDDSSVLKNNFKSQDVISFRDTVANLRAEYDKLNAELAQTPKTSDAYKKLRADLDTLSPKLKNAENAYSELQTRLRTAGGEQQADARLQRLINRIKEYMAVNTKASKKYGTQFQSILSQASVKQDIDGIRRLEMEFANLTSQIKIAGDQGKTFGQIIMDSAKRFSQWMTLTGVISTGWRELRKMVSTVIELDTAMTNLKKVSDETATTYSNFLKSSIKQAQELHSSVSDLIDQTTTWKKLGFDLNQAQQLSRASMIYSNVGDVDNEQAVTNIVSAIKAFDIEVQDVMKIPDVYNRLGNEFAVSSKNLGSGMSKAASTLALMGSSFEEVAALLTGSGEILGDNRLEEIGNGLRVVTLRIMNQAGALHELNEEYEDLESVSKTQQQVYEYTRGQVNIMSDLDPNTFKKPYEILKEIAEIFDDLNQTEQSKLIQLLFGKNRADVGTSIIKAFQSGQIQKALEAAENSAGSAEKEFANFEKSIESHLNDLTAAFQGLSSVVVNSELIKGFVDAGTGALNLLTDIISRFGTLQTIIPVVFTSLSLFRNVGRAKVFALKNEYAHCNVVVTRNEFMQVA